MNNLKDSHIYKWTTIRIHNPSTSTKSDAFLGGPARVMNLKEGDKARTLNVIEEKPFLHCALSVIHVGRGNTRAQYGEGRFFLFKRERSLFAVGCRTTFLERKRPPPPSLSHDRIMSLLLSIFTF